MYKVTSPLVSIASRLISPAKQHNRTIVIQEDTDLQISSDLRLPVRWTCHLRLFAQLLVAHGDSAALNSMTSVSTPRLCKNLNVSSFSKFTRVACDRDAGARFLAELQPFIWRKNL